ncbi:hypothetical protein CRV00_05020 [Malaciobacter molluscorum]|uniref:hypothetical protein n=1 Tax=Malaciobacter molluscorum TaxID=1032072 RepID=UPI00100B9DE5|nr:hypothetical protein [Malaciobacter molluscorum]RXJ95120.1 hypothetical protein CRV00_05020 [Malaciobacter molluscorum]
MILGQCPYCKSNVISKKITAQGKQIKLYTCENSKKEYDETDSYVFTSDSTCRFRIYSNALFRWNKRSISEYEIKKLLKDEQIVVRLHGKKGDSEYFKYAIPHEEYGISILWEEDVQEEL